jgi:plasmid stability protein
MGNLQIKSVPEEVHEELRRRAAEAGITIRDYLLDLIRRDLALPSRPQWLESLRRLRPVDLDRPAAEYLREERSGRERRADRR